MRRCWIVAVWLCLALIAGVSAAGADETLDGEEFTEEEGEQAKDEREFGTTQNTFEVPDAGTDVVGSVKTVPVPSGDTLLDIARRHGLGYQEIRRANPDMDMWIPEPGQSVTIPTRFILPPGPREGVVVNLPEMRLYYYPEPGPNGRRVVKTYPISIGRMDWSTPVGDTQVTTRLENPAWFPPPSVRERAEEQGQTLPRRVEPGPDNPLGDYAIGLDISGYFIHGTNKPAGVGMRASSGCIRMYPEDIEELVHAVRRGMPVRILDEPIKAGLSRDGRVFLQSYPPLDESQDAPSDARRLAVEAVAEALQNRSARVDYKRLQEAARDAAGRPVDISREGGGELAQGH